MKNKLKGFGKVFAFTFKQHTGTKGYRFAIIAGVLLCLLIPALIMTAVEIFGGSGDDAAAEHIFGVSEVFVVDKSRTDDVDWSFLNSLGGLTDVKYTADKTDVDAALAAAAAAPKSLVVVVDDSDDGFAVSVLRPEGTELTSDDVNGFTNFLNFSFQYILMQKSGLDMTSIITLTEPISTEIISDTVSDTGDEREVMSSDLRNVFSMIIGYVLVMVIYFMVLLYGQGVANTIIMEKNSKLMEFFLLSVDPGAMITGKVLAVSLAGAIQFASWAIALILSFVGGTLIVKAINPLTDMTLVLLFEGIGAMSGMFSVGGIICALLILLAGFLLYCSLSAIGGALAGKPEDLSSTNILFSLVLVASFFAIVFSGGLTGGIGELNPILLWIPFTGVLSAPSQLILGEIAILSGIAIFLVTVVVSLIIMGIAGRLYTALVHHRGNPPKLSDAFRLIRKN